MLNKVKSAFINQEKLYESEMNKILISFDQTDQWLDLVKSLKNLDIFLKEIIKIKQKNSQKTIFSFQPFLRQIFISLNKCLDSKMPSGIHQKTLETYDTFFVALNNEQIAENLAFFSFGLFNVLENASERVLDMF
ncbi:hypothetical protein MHBO_003781 [Bonamia ostreae]|uniref:DOP1 N-terminal domain-containing protein n=1 Tax=Bonamia ostreae TaxID=126728 RepID=A0ABV2ARH7_9EUKA